MGECMNLNLIPHQPTVGENMNLSLMPQCLPAEIVVTGCFQSVLDMLLAEQLLRTNLNACYLTTFRLWLFATCFSFLCLVGLFGLGVHKTTSICGALFRTELFGLPPRFVEVTNAVDWTGSCVLRVFGR